jgi:hypothetical protein
LFYSLATFYKSFRLQPIGKKHVCVCVGTACFVKGGENIFDAFRIAHVELIEWLVADYGFEKMEAARHRLARLHRAGHPGGRQDRHGPKTGPRRIPGRKVLFLVHPLITDRGKGFRRISRKITLATFFSFDDSIFASTFPLIHSRTLRRPPENAPRSPGNQPQVQHAGEWGRCRVIKESAVMIKTDSAGHTETEKASPQGQLIIWPRRFPSVQTCPTGADMAEQVAKIEQAHQAYPWYFASA